MSPESRFNVCIFIAEFMCLSPLCSTWWAAKIDRSREKDAWVQGHLLSCKVSASSYVYLFWRTDRQTEML